MHTLLSSTLKTLENLIQPKYCIFCMNRILAKDSLVICPNCRSKIKRDNPYSYANYGNYTYNNLIKKNFSKDETDILRVYYPFKYKGLIQDGLQRFKYNRELGLLNYFSEELYLFFKETISINENIDFISYVPLHRKKLRERGFNQAELLAKKLSKKTEIRLLKDLLHRKVYTPSQSKLSKEERRINMDSVFGVNLKYKNIIRNSKVLLIDDIITTGSTTAECTRELALLEANTVVLAIAGG